MGEDKKIVFCKSGGCSAKLGAGLLRHVLEKLPKKTEPNLLVGFDGSDDAAVYKLTEDMAIVQTLDFFPPMVKDPYIFGQIAAANSVSDIYAMGGEVRTALNIVCFPEKMDLNILGEILRGGADKIQEAGGVLAGGHSIADEGIKYGLSVTGVIHPEHIIRNNTCEPGDVLILTKPLGVGIVTAADRVNAASEGAMKKSVRSMTTLNKYAAEVLKSLKVHACTDITGFGLLGHLMEMLAERCSATLFMNGIPYIGEAWTYAADFLITGAGQKNRNFVGDRVSFENIPFPMEEILFDPQTSGGLLAAVAPEDATKALIAIQRLGMQCGRIGVVTEWQNKSIIVKK
jgi:selenide, water dikinase